MKIHHWLLPATLLASCSLAPASFAAPAIRVPQARPFLILPGYSLGKVQLGQSRETVHRLMGKPAVEEQRECRRLDFGSPKMGKLDLDRWYRTGMEGDSFNEPRGTFEVLYKGGRVIQVTTNLDGYRTVEGLSVKSPIKAFIKRYGEADETPFDYDADRPGGSSHAMVTYLAFEKAGLSLISDFHGGFESPTAVDRVSVHSKGMSYVLN